VSSDTIVSPINALPQGLLDLLGTRALGQNPNELLQAVRPIVDMTPFWASGAAIQTFVAISGAVTAVNGVVPTAQLTQAVVPIGKIWIPLTISLTSLGQGAGDTCRVRPCILLPGTPPTTPIEFGDSNSLASSATSYSLSWLDFWESQLRPYSEGFVFGAWIETNTVAVSGQTMVYLLRYLEF